MNSLRNPDIRVRDIRKLLGIKSQKTIWDEGCDTTSEWVVASLENDKTSETLFSWLTSKKVPAKNEALLINDSWTNVQRISWGELINTPNHFFGRGMFQAVDLDLNWVLEYQPQEIARFGRFRREANA